MTRFYTLLAVCATAVVAMSSCGGGGGSAPSPSRAVPTPGGQGTPAPAAANRTRVGTAQLTIKLPAVVTAKNKTVRARNAAGQRSPAYVNPTAGNVLDIYVDGSLIPNIDNSVGSNDSLFIQNSADGTQSVSLPLFSTSSNDIVVVEWDGPAHNAELAVGETDSGNFTPGTPVNIPLTMLMNARNIGVLDIYSQSDPEIMTGQTYYGVGFSCPGGGVQSQLGFFEADYLGQFVPVSGVGGTTAVSVTGSPNAPGTTQITQTSIGGIYQIAWDGPCDGVTVSASATNPISPLLDTENFGAPNNSYGYYDCYQFGECSAGGPYQSLWNFYNESNPGYRPQDYFNSPTLGNTIVVTASPNPSQSGV